MPDIHIVVITSNALNRSGIEALIAKAGAGMQVTASFGDLSLADRFMKDNRVDILIIDDTLPRSVDVGRVIRKLLTQHPSLGILMVASRPTGSLIRRVLDCGARGFLHKDDAMDVTLIEAIQGMRKGGLYLSRRANQLIQAQRALPDKMTSRDVDVLQLMADGYEAREISAQIGVSEKTVYRILDGLRAIYGAQNNANLINIAYRAKLLPSNDPNDHE
ncbi:MAG: response regulator transcription factor [Anaerolinea sp.]|nr:response regulator transcription factor [Anaerolinea sp.]